MKIPTKRFHFVNTSRVLIVLILFQTMIFCAASFAQTSAPQELENDEKDRLVVLWTTDNREVALKIPMMYTYNAKMNNWWEDIVIIVWGPSAKLLGEDEVLQGKVKELLDLGIEVKACKGCADQYNGITDTLEALGVEVLYVGKEFTDCLKSESKILTL